MWRLDAAVSPGQEFMTPADVLVQTRVHVTTWRGGGGGGGGGGADVIRQLAFSGCTENNGATM